MSVGDKIRFERHGEVLEGTIIKIDGDVIHVV